MNKDTQQLPLERYDNKIPNLLIVLSYCMYSGPLNQPFYAFRKAIIIIK